VRSTRAAEAVAELGSFSISIQSLNRDDYCQCRPSGTSQRTVRLLVRCLQIELNTGTPEAPPNKRLWVATVKATNPGRYA